MLARQIILLQYPSNQANPFAPMLLQALWSLQKSQLLWNQANPASFCKTPGVPLRKLVRCTEAQKCLFVSPLLATLTHSVSRKSFPCHSYANTRDGGASAPPRHPLLPPSHAPRWRPYPLCSHSIAHTSRHHGGVGGPVNCQLKGGEGDRSQGCNRSPGRTSGEEARSASPDGGHARITRL